MTALSYPLKAAETDDGNWRIVNYWSEWCAPCRVEIPMFNELSVRLANSNVIIVGVNFDEDPRELTLEIADDMGIALYQKFSLNEASLFLRCPASDIISLGRGH